MAKNVCKAQNIFKVHVYDYVQKQLHVHVHFACHNYMQAIFFFFFFFFFFTHVRSEGKRLEKRLKSLNIFFRA